MSFKMEINETQYIYVETTALFGGVPSLEVKKGERYTFRVNPLCKWRRNKIDFSADGTIIPYVSRNNRRYSKARYHSLCATINQNEFNPFNVGSWLEDKEMKEDGAIHFFPNKSKEDLTTGKGYVIVEVTRVD